MSHLDAPPCTRPTQPRRPRVTELFNHCGAALNRLGRAANAAYGVTAKQAARPKSDFDYCALLRATFAWSPMSRRSLRLRPTRMGCLPGQAWRCARAIDGHARDRGSGAAIPSRCTTNVSRRFGWRPEDDGSTVTMAPLTTSDIQPTDTKPRQRRRPSRVCCG